MTQRKFQIAVLTVAALAIGGLVAAAIALSNQPAQAHNNHPTPSITQIPLCEETLNGDSDTVFENDIAPKHLSEDGYYCYKHTIRKNRPGHERVITVVVLTKPFEVPSDGSAGDWLSWEVQRYSPGKIAKDDSNIGECGNSKTDVLRPKSANGKFGVSTHGNSEMRGNLKRPEDKFLWRTKGPSSEYPRGSKIYEGMIAQARVVPVTNEMNGNYVSGCEARVRYVIRVEAENPPPPPTTAPPPQPPPNPTPVDSDLIQTDDCNTPGKGGHDPGMNGRSPGSPTCAPTRTTSSPAGTSTARTPPHADATTTEIPTVTMAAPRYHPQTLTRTGTNTAMQAMA